MLMDTTILLILATIVVICSFLVMFRRADLLSTALWGLAMPVLLLCLLVVFFPLLVVYTVYQLLSYPILRAGKLRWEASENELFRRYPTGEERLFEGIMDTASKHNGFTWRWDGDPSPSGFTPKCYVETIDKTGPMRLLAGQREEGEAPSRYRIRFRGRLKCSYSMIRLTPCIHEIEALEILSMERILPEANRLVRPAKPLDDLLRPAASPPSAPNTLLRPDLDR